MRRCFVIILAACCLSCAGPDRDAKAQRKAVVPKPAVPAAPSLTDWLGVYGSPDEIGGYSGTVLVLENGMNPGEIAYRMRFYSDANSANEFEQDESLGGCLTDGPRLYLPEAKAYARDEKPLLFASLTRLTMVNINGHTTLMRDDALRAFRNENKLYDYGILIKVSDDSEARVDLTRVRHPSIKLLYADPGKAWNDPFVYGPNAR